MKSTFAKAAFFTIASLTVVHSFADGMNAKTEPQAQPTVAKPRGAAKAELEQARREGFSSRIDNSYPNNSFQEQGPGKTRLQVLDELEDAKRHGLTTIDNSYPSKQFQQSSSTKTRAAVQAEATGTEVIRN